MPIARRIHACLELTCAIGGTRTLEPIYEAALDALANGLGVARASILLFDPDGVMRFKAWRGLSAAYRAAVEGHTPWQPDSPSPAPIIVQDVLEDPALASYGAVFEAEGIRALGFIPLISLDRVIGKFMLYYAEPTRLTDDELDLAALIAAQVAFAVERTRAEIQLRRNEERLRFALDAAQMGTWDWDLRANAVHWSDNLETIHGLPPGSFDGTFEGYQREVHPEDRDRVMASVQRALTGEGDHEVEYRLVAPDGTIRWAEGKGRVHLENGEPVRMSGVCMIVTARKEAELARLEAAHEAARLKDEFLATLSHELRTPMNAILGWVQMLESEMVPPDRRADALKIIGRNARMQAQLIEDILDVSRIISGKLEVDRVSLSLEPLLASAVQAALPAALAKNVHLAADVPAALPPVAADANRLQQVLGNVLSNAVKFTESGGRVSIRAVADTGGRVVVEVSDTGAGIAPDFLPYVFERFRQADSRATRRHGGLGLGLAIARHLVELHGGSIDVASAGSGAGTTIRIALPALTESLATELVPGSTAALGPVLEGATVLVVDDHDDSRELLRAILESAGAAVTGAASAAEALARATSATDLLVADIAMPDVDGYSLLAAFRERYPHVPAIAVSAYARPEDRAHAQTAGFGAYIAKPVSATELLSTAASLVVGFVRPI